MSRSALEPISNLTTQACIAALCRSTVRRGCPASIYTENGSNFAGTKSETESLQNILKHEHAYSFQAEASNLNMKWILIPPPAPHFGGLWEASMPSTRYQLRRISSVPVDIKKSSPQKRWFVLQNLLGSFSKRWTNEYVSSLQERLKEKSESEKLRFDDLVCLTYHNVNPIQWPLGRTTRTRQISGPDKFVRVVKVKTSNGVFNRSIAKLRKLPLLNDSLE